MILLIFLFVIVGIGFGTFLITPLWEAEARLLVLQNQSQQLALFSDLTKPTPPEKNPAVDLVNVLTGKKFGAEVVREFRLDELAREKAQNPRNLRERLKVAIVNIVKSPLSLLQAIGLLTEKPPNFFASALEDLIDDMQEIELEEGTSTIRLVISAETPDLAVGIANHLGEMLIKEASRYEQIEASGAYRFIQEQLGSVEQAVIDAENKLVLFKEREGVVLLDAERSLRLNRLEELREERDDTLKVMASLNAKLVDLRQQLSERPELIAISEVTGINDIHKQLRSEMLETEIGLEGKGVGLLGTHPEVAEQRARLKSTKQKLEQEEPRVLLNRTMAPNPLHQDLEREIVQAEGQLAESTGRLEALAPLIAQLETDVSEMSRKEMVLDGLERKVAAAKERFDTLGARSLELEVQQFTPISQFDIKISDPAFIPEGADPDWPIWWLSIALAIILGGPLALGTALFVEYWKSTVSWPKDVSESIGGRVLGTVPHARVEKFVADMLSNSR